MQLLIQKLILPFKLAWRSLILHKGRTFLTVLGIMIGISSVIIVMSAGESIKALMLGELESYGTDFIEVEIKAPNTSQISMDNVGALIGGMEITTLTSEDADAIGKMSNIKSYSSGIMGQDVISYLGENKVVTFLAGTERIPEVMGVEIENGRLYTDEEDKQLSKVVILGSKVAEELFGNQDPISKSVRIGRLKFKVVGVAKEKGASFGFDYDNLVYIPLKTAQKLIMGIDHVMFIMAKMHNTDIQEQTAEEMILLLRERHNTKNIQDDDFAVITAEEMMDMVNVVFDGITLLLVSIAGISLLVGGIGIMNIMYVSVTERTFEIGLRKAVGARPGQILWQFLWEAIVITIFGGIIGVVFGVVFTWLVSFGASQVGYSWDFTLPAESVIIAFVFCAVVGLIFGYWPALKAARMNPITALRQEQ